MKISKDQIVFAYHLFLNRVPGDKEVDRMHRNVETIEEVRRIFLNSPEFKKICSHTYPAPELLSDRTIIHLHIPKTAGTSLTAILSGGLPPGRRLTLGTNNMAGLLDMPLEERAKLKLLFGHMEFGVDRHLRQDVVYLCNLRLPGPRLLSYYRYISRIKDHPLYREMNDAQMSFGDFLRHSVEKPALRNEVDNGQVRYLAGAMTSSGFTADARLFETARRNIFGQNVIFGLTEHFDLFLERLVKEKILSEAPMTKQNVAPPGTSYEAELERLSSEERDLLDGFIYWDTKLYEAGYAHLFNKEGPQDET